jgi:hypothetical protein
MKKVLIALSLLSLTLFLTACQIPFFGKEKKAALQVGSTPKSTVFLDEDQIGITPFFDDDLKAGEYTLKLVPEQTSSPLASWQQKIKLTPSILTVVNREFAATEEESSHEILTLEEISDKDNSSLAVVTDPDRAVIKIDAEPKGFAPITIDQITPGDHEIVISLPGFREKSIKAKTQAGYKLTVSVKLAKETTPPEDEEEATESAEAKESPTPKSTPKPETTPAPVSTTSASPPPKPYVKIKETGTGWLRVRMEPSLEATEAAKVNVGTMHPYLGEQSGWYKISYETAKEGWVYATYAEKVE